jgi:hypothetical protein
MNELYRYLKEKDGKVHRAGIAINMLAEQIVCSPYTLYMAALGHKDLSLGLRMRIEECTSGRVGRDTYGRKAA